MEHSQSMDLSGGEDYHGAAGGDYHQMDHGAEYQQQPQDYGSQQSGGGSSTTEFKAEVNVQGQQDDPQQQQGGPYQQNQQPGGYQPGNFPRGGYVPNVAPGGPPYYPPPQKAPPPKFNPNSAAGAHPAYPPPQQAPPQNVYPPQGTAPAYTPQGTPSHPGHGGAYGHPQGTPAYPAQGPVSAPPQQVVTPQRLPPGMPGANGAMGFGPGAMIRPEIGPPVPWTTELFGCFEDCYGCPLAFIAPCITFGQIAEITDTGYNKCQTAGIIYAFALFLGIPCLYSYTYRTKMRHKFNLREDPLDDFCTHFWCECCALLQAYRELRYRGIEPSLGYELQMTVVNQAMAAPVAPRMAK